jgi:hypothetical protein
MRVQRFGKTIGTILLAITLGAAMVTLPACGGKKAPSVAPSSSAKVLSAVRRIGEVVAQVQVQEQALYAAGDVPAGAHAAITKGFADTSASVLVAIDALQKSAGGDAQQVVKAVSDGVKSLAQTFRHLSSKQAAQLSGWLDTAAALIDVALAS